MKRKRPKETGRRKGMGREDSWEERIGKVYGRWKSDKSSERLKKYKEGVEPKRERKRRDNEREGRRGHQKRRMV